MRVLGIETSCDETSVALLETEGGFGRVIKEMTATQIATHKEYGGVVPEVAARLHAETLPLILKEMGLKKEDVDGIAVTRGPGLITSLRVGVDHARALAYAWKKPLVGVNHMEGHIAANFIGGNSKGQGPSAKDYPAVVLIVSGGHTEIILMKHFGAYELMGATQDDAVGEAFDKVAKMLELGYPGGPAVSKRAEQGNADAYELPRPMMSAPNFDFSYSGLKTAVLYTVQRKKDWSEHDINDLCASFQKAAIEVLVVKTVRAAKQAGAKTVFLAGGVAANRTLRTELPAACEKAGIACMLPDLKYCTDNAAMIAMAGAARMPQSDDWRTMEADPNWELGR